MNTKTMVTLHNTYCAWKFLHEKEEHLKKQEHVQRGRNGDLVVALETETGGDHFPSIVERDDYTAMIFWWAFQLIS